MTTGQILNVSSLMHLDVVQFAVMASIFWCICTSNCRFLDTYCDF